MQTDIKDAIERRLCIDLHYSPGNRLVEPHTLGWSSKGDVLFRAFQTEGATASGENNDWKLFRVDRINALSITDQDFPGPRPGYSRDDKAMRGGIIAQL